MSGNELIAKPLSKLVEEAYPNSPALVSSIKALERKVNELDENTHESIMDGERDESVKERAVKLGWIKVFGQALKIAIEHEIDDGYFDEVVYNRFISGENDMIDRFCDGCDHKCSDDCDGRRYRV